jgi:hypothetical protein
MARRFLPPLLACVALVLDLQGNHRGAVVVLFLAIPAAFVLALDCFGDALESRCTLGRPILAGISLFLLVLSAALRSQAVVGGVPALAVSALVLSLLLYGVLALTAVRVTAPRRRQHAAPVR